MSAPVLYTPGSAFGADIEKKGESWTLVLVRTLRHSPQHVWDALTDPAQLHEWAPFDVDRNLGSTGPVKISTVGAPSEYTLETTVRRAEPPRVLEYSWGENEMRWELEPAGKGTRLTLWHNIDRRFIAMGAAGWHVCLDVLDHLLSDQPIGRIVAGDALKLDGWRRLHAEYAKQFKVETPNLEN